MENWTWTGFAVFLLIYLPFGIACNNRVATVIATVVAALIGFALVWEQFKSAVFRKDEEIKKLEEEIKRRKFFN